MAWSATASNPAKLREGAFEKGNNMKQSWLIGLACGVACLKSMAGVSIGVSLQVPFPVGVSVHFPAPVYVAPPVVVTRPGPPPIYMPPRVFVPAPVVPPPPVVVYRPMVAYPSVVVAPWPRPHHHRHMGWYGSRWYR
jgi:hypothetical protein